MTEALRNKTDMPLDEWFKSESMRLLAEQLTSFPYPGYPERRLYYEDCVSASDCTDRLYLPEGPWHASTKNDENISEDMVIDFINQGYTIDSANRPLHPWINEMLVKSIGVVTGLGFYRKFGANYTADPVIFRHDKDEPLLLLIQRNDTGMLALPGGFIDPGESGTDAALREAEEETLIRVVDFNPETRIIYQGPIADVRVTANAWPETTGVKVDLDPKLTKHLPVDSFRGDPNEVKSAGWYPVDDALKSLFGSHRLIVELALE